MDQSVSAQSAAPAKSKSAPAESKSAPASELDYSRPIECDGLSSPMPIGNDRKSGVRCYPNAGRFKAGNVDGLVDRIRILPSGFVELRVVQSTQSMDRDPGDVCWLIITPSGMVLDVAGPRDEPVAKKR